MPKLSQWSRGLLAALLAGALLLLAGLPVLYPSGGVAAAPLQDGPVQVFVLNTAGIAATTTFTPTATGGRWSALGTDRPPVTAEIWLTVSEPTVNTTTLALQVSPDNSTWLAHSTIGALATDVVTDTTVYTTAAIHGVYYRIVATVSNTQTLTPTIKVVLR